MWIATELEEALAHCTELYEKLEAMELERDEALAHCTELADEVR